MNPRRRIIGTVASNKMIKTVVVEIKRSFRHPLYKKVVHESKRVKAHDEIGCQIGDQVQIVESRPLSHDKRWVIEKILKHAGEAAKPMEIINEVVEEKSDASA
jgi:small subunit ribosomal protein S17